MLVLQSLIVLYYTRTKLFHKIKVVIQYLHTNKITYRLGTPTYMILINIVFFNTSIVKYTHV